jgi:hypothetical protein
MTGGRSSTFTREAAGRRIVSPGALMKSTRGQGPQAARQLSPTAPKALRDGFAEQAAGAGGAGGGGGVGAERGGGGEHGVRADGGGRGVNVADGTAADAGGAGVRDRAFG